MIKLIAILVMCGSVVWGATFTDVTVEGTPYLTTNVLIELELSALSRGLNPDGNRFPFSGSGHPANQKITDSDIAFIEVGDRANALSYGLTYHYVTRFADMRVMCNNAWRIWIPEIPTHGFESWEGLFYTNQVDFFVEAGLSPNGWRNATNYNPAVNNWRDFNDPMYIYRSSIEQGDIVGPWIIDDLQLAMDHMQHQARTPRYNGQYETPMLWQVSTNGIATNYHTGAVWNFSYGWWPDLDGAQAEAETRFSNGGASGRDRIRVYSRLIYSHYYETWLAELRNYTGYAVNFGGVETNSALYFFGGDVKAYMYAFAQSSYDTTQWDDHGYNVESNLFTEVDSYSVPAGTITNQLTGANAFGDPSVIPAWPTGVSVPSDIESGYRGFDTKWPFKIYSPNHPYTRE